MSEPVTNIIPFGKYKGRLVEELLLDDPSYVHWLSGQDWFRAKFTFLHQIIVNRGVTPEETPEHNALQVRFLDDDFCLRFIRCYRPDIDEMARKALQALLDRSRSATQKEIAETEREQERQQHDLMQHAEYTAGRVKYRPYHSPETLRAEIEKTADKILDLKMCLTFLSGSNVASERIEFDFLRAFEPRGVDVALTVRATCPHYDLAATLALQPQRYSDVLPIEIKPTVSDDYPAVLRQMKRNESVALFVGEYTGNGATQEQFIKTMATANIRVIFARDVDAAGVPS